ncbi:transglutaminase-like cysteine peptidase (plasmid) [Leisingera sp. M527]|uniref:transglutaminase-like cysteine peptidase n=1 Tax=Leisingera sp. M527 TaxID=2867014 RepID=UPI0021A92105|nr:transglutaminase-like cysteine peptidase [Leisingera sp. M527]UWQ35719.1 transglutaminase-like cysteine peptidase [Leisingera sp. M527]
MAQRQSEPSPGQGFGRRMRQLLLPGIHRVLAAGLMAAALATSAAAVQPLPSAEAPPDLVPVSRQVLPPLAHARFCLRHPGQCAVRGGSPQPAGSAQAQLAAVVAINLAVNRDITPQADGTAQGITDEWRLNAVRGDCEDYALLKRKRLLDLGWPSASLRLATVLTPAGTGHAVLIARFRGGDFALDNLTNEIRPWRETGYRFLKIQSETDPKTWYSVAAPQAGGGLS